MSNSNFTFTPADLNIWAENRLVTDQQVTAIEQYVQQYGTAIEQSGSSVEERKGFNFVSIATYFGGFMILLAYTIFIGMQWQVMTDMNKVVISAVTIGILWGIGVFLKSREFKMAGNLLIFAGTGVVPLLIYTLQEMMGLWPADMDYESYYRIASQTWVPLELITIVITAGVLWWTRFPLITFLLGFWGWFLSMDLIRWIYRTEDWYWGEEVQVATVVFGFAMLALGFAIQQLYKKEFSFWFYLFGHIIVLGSLSTLAFDHEGIYALIFIVAYLGFVVASVKLQSRLFLVFGAIGSYGYLCYLAFNVFDNELGFTFSLAVVGLSIVLSAVGYQKYVKPMLEYQLT